MSWFLELTNDQWDRLDDLVRAFTTLVVALLVAWFASRKESSLQKSERHFAFRDERALFYSEFIEKMNNAFGKYWACQGIEDSTAPEMKAAETAALELDTHTHKIQIRAPNFVAHSCLNMNGHIQYLVGGLVTNGQIVEMRSDEYEKAKRNMLRAMRRDIDLIEQTSNRRRYSKRVGVENKRYFAEANIQEPDK